ncbi:hypothetical protein [Nannocystis sp. SCPEA4]|uniref:hypothetical protein n=1 Tax=Nannocystis sp. SCPEA4 TaxID=2996787 RepID=UPI00226F7291|nr:hypothetical protein [Nannocystis sp. SCPEA4]MCY1062144.1 hypothetical protein [Nannocystis sp. SCPEA4]
MTPDTEEKIRNLIQLGEATKHGDEPAHRAFVAALEAMLEARYEGEWIGLGEKDSIDLTPGLLASLLRVAAGEPVRLGRARFNNAPPCDHSRPERAPSGRVVCADCGEWL